MHLNSPRIKCSLVVCLFTVCSSTDSLTQTVAAALRSAPAANKRPPNRRHLPRRQTWLPQLKFRLPHADAQRQQLPFACELLLFGQLCVFIVMFTTRVATITSLRAYPIATRRRHSEIRSCMSQTLRRIGDYLTGAETIAVRAIPERTIRLSVKGRPTTRCTPFSTPLQPRPLRSCRPYYR